MSFSYGTSSGGWRDWAKKKGCLTEVEEIWQDIRSTVSTLGELKASGQDTSTMQAKQAKTISRLAIRFRQLYGNEPLPFIHRIREESVYGILHNFVEPATTVDFVEKLDDTIQQLDDNDSHLGDLLTLGTKAIEEARYQERTFGAPYDIGDEQMEWLKRKQDEWEGMQDVLAVNQHLLAAPAAEDEFLSPDDEDVQEAWSLLHQTIQQEHDLRIDAVMQALAGGCDPMDIESNRSVDSIRSNAADESLETLQEMAPWLDISVGDPVPALAGMRDFPTLAALASSAKTSARLVKELTETLPVQASMGEITAEKAQEIKDVYSSLAAFPELMRLYGSARDWATTQGQLLSSRVVYDDSIDLHDETQVGTALLPIPKLRLACLQLLSGAGDLAPTDTSVDEYDGTGKGKGKASTQY